MRIFLDENFPLGLERQLKNAGFEAEQRYEDAAAKAGLYCMPFLRELGSIAPKNARRTSMRAC